MTQMTEEQIEQLGYAYRDYYHQAIDLNELRERLLAWLKQAGYVQLPEGCVIVPMNNICGKASAG